MTERTYISKFNTIIKGYTINTGLNPVSELLYGSVVSRSLIYFDHCKIKQMCDDGMFPDMSKLTHTLKITNAGSIDFTQAHTNEITPINGTLKKRAASFDLIFFLIPEEWDSGKGFDYSDTYFGMDFFDTKQSDRRRLISEDGCNWFQRRNGYPWKEDGVYSNSSLEKEYNKWSAGLDSIVIGRQRFDVGTENISFDITDVMNKFITGELDNYGIGIAYAPDYEKEEQSWSNYVGFMTNKTPTFFEPFVETRYDDYISDDRGNFVLNKNNKLYLYCTIGSELKDLDNIPTCSIMNTNGDVIMDNIEVKHFSKGVYYVDVMFHQNEHKAGDQYYDVWGSITYDGVDFSPVELDFTLMPASNWFTIGNSIEPTPSFTPNVSGINENERIKRGDIRKLVVNNRVTYTNKESQVISGVEVRLYVMDGNRELTVIDFEPLNKTYNETFMTLDTSMLIPQMYHVDVKIKYGMEEIIHHDVVKFEIVNEIGNKYF